MNEFLMLFRNEPTDAPAPSPDEMQGIMKLWQDWIGGIAAQGKFVGTNPLKKVGKTIYSDGMMTDGPYAEIKEIVGGYLIVKADTLEEALEMAKGCPNLQNGGNVEVREVMPMDL